MSSLSRMIMSTVFVVATISTGLVTASGAQSAPVAEKAAASAPSSGRSFAIELSDVLSDGFVFRYQVIDQHNETGVYRTWDWIGVYKRDSMPSYADTGKYMRYEWACPQ